MRWLALTILGITLATAARGEDIVDVLRRSQQQRLDAMARAPASPRTRAVQHSFEQLRALLPSSIEVELCMIEGPILAETLHGHIVVANESLGDLPEGERLFVLAHELGHVVGGHWLQMSQVYRRWIPGEVTPEQTDPVATRLGREASLLAHRQEFDADAFAVQLLRQVGRSSDDAYAAFLHLGMQQDTATHPGTRKRVASLRAALPTE